MNSNTTSSRSTRWQSLRVNYEADNTALSRQPLGNCQHRPSVRVQKSVGQRQAAALNVPTESVSYDLLVFVSPDSFCSPSLVLVLLFGRLLIFTRPSPSILLFLLPVALSQRQTNAATWSYHNIDDRALCYWQRRWLCRQRHGQRVTRLLQIAVILSTYTSLTLLQCTLSQNELRCCEIPLCM